MFLNYILGFAYNSTNSWCILSATKFVQSYCYMYTLTLSIPDVVMRHLHHCVPENYVYIINDLQLLQLGHNFGL